MVKKIGTICKNNPHSGFKRVALYLYSQSAIFAAISQSLDENTDLLRKKVDIVECVTWPDLR